MDYWLIFLTGLTVGGVTCITVQGGLLASTITERIGLHKKLTLQNQLLPILAFLLAKLIGYILLGLLLGTIGETLTWNDTMIIVVQIIVGLYMIGLSLHFLKVHPIFKYLIPQPPEFLTSMLSEQSKSRSLFAPFFLGFLTVFIPCGTTLAMEALAISTGNPWTAALVLGVFVLGTFPLFIILGLMTSSANFVFKRHFYKAAAFLIITLGLTSINGSLVVMDFPITAQKLYYSLPFIQKDQALGNIQDGIQTIKIQITSSGYQPRYIRVNQNMPVKLILNSKGTYNCALAFRIPQYKIAKNLKPNSIEIVEFTPTKIGKTYFSCSMGMYIGLIEVQ